MKHLTAIALFFVVLTSSAQPPTTTPKDSSQLYMQVLRGERSVESLSAAERQQILAIHGAMARSCGRQSPECEKACEAANNLKDAAEELARCAKRHDLTDDCSRKFRDTKYAFEEYESSVSDIDDGCS